MGGLGAPAAELRRLLLDGNADMDSEDAARALLAPLLAARRLCELALPFAPAPGAASDRGRGARAVRDAFVPALLGAAPLQRVNGRRVSLKERVAAVSKVPAAPPQHSRRPRRERMRRG